MTKNVAINRDRRIAGICLVFSSPAAQVREAVTVRLASLIPLVEPSVENIFIITNRDGLPESQFGSNVRFVGDVACPNAGAPILSTVFSELRAQIQTARYLASISNEIDIILWRGRSSTFVIPLLLARIKNKKSILLLESKGSALVSKAYTGPLGIGGFILSRIYSVIQRITYSLSDRLVVNVPGLLKESWLAKYGGKVFPYPAPIRFITHDFKISTRLSQRQLKIGYIGRMSTEKGVLNFVKAIPLICSKMNEVEFFLAGGGPLLHQVERELAIPISQNQVIVHDWITHDELPTYLNQLKLLVLPSEYEGLPTIVLEAMACGTPVLATPVGAIPDIITDGETGFIMEDNSPECIARHVVRVLKYPDLDKISENGVAVVDKEYRYEVLRSRYRDIIEELHG